ncbi:syntaxin-8-like [Corticium candelabrum]|uniref:syntaxin-8-like n=1 Tax=Corticium candelabrum TaxID=121492 RepID=UPI002E372E35|nr:syntaxin-8-like [Corticium candelabrum]
MSTMRDAWITEYESLQQTCVSIREKINERNQVRISGGDSSKLNSSIRIMINGYSRSLDKLKSSLARDTSSFKITKGEVTRRENLVDNMTAKEGQLNKAFKEEPSARSATSRDALIGSQPIGVNTNPWLDTEHEETRGLTNTELMQTHQEVIRQQDEGLDELAKAMQRQKHIGLTMHDEIERQDEILDDLHDNVGRTTARIERETRHVEKIRVKASDKGLCCAVTLLFLLIVVLMCIPKQ